MNGSRSVGEPTALQRFVSRRSTDLVRNIDVDEIRNLELSSPYDDEKFAEIIKVTNPYQK